MAERNESLEKDILTELKKTGYPTEIISSSIIQQQGWRIIHNPSYLDDIEGCSREYDIRAYKEWHYRIRTENKELGVFLIVECKKSEKPWVFFTTDESHSRTRLGDLLHTTENWLFSNRRNAQGRLSDELLREHHHYFRKPRLARTFYEPFKKQEKSDNSSQMIYSAVMSAIKATLFHEQGDRGKRWSTIFYPIIIFSGNLFEAVVSSTVDITLSAVDNLQLSFNYMLPLDPRSGSIWDSQKTFIVDIVHESYLSQFLKVIDEEHANLAECLEKSFKSEEKSSAG